jgi:hypothetical protein
MQQLPHTCIYISSPLHGYSTGSWGLCAAMWTLSQVWVSCCSSVAALLQLCLRCVVCSVACSVAASMDAVALFLDTIYYRYTIYTMYTIYRYHVYTLYTLYTCKLLYRPRKLAATARCNRAATEHATAASLCILQRFWMLSQRVEEWGWSSTQQRMQQSCNRAATAASL